MNKYLFFFKKFYFSFLFIFIAGYTWAAPKETLYFPLAWEITSQAPLNIKDFTDGKVTFYNTSIKKEISFPFKNSVNVNQTQVGFISSKGLKLPAGKYSKVTLSVMYKNKTIVYSYDANFIINPDKVTPLAGLFAKSVLDNSNKATSNKQVAINQSAIDISDIQKEISGAAPEHINLQNVNSPKVLQRLDNERRGNTAYYGVEIKMPCRYSGVVAITFRKDNEPIEYYRELEISEARCLVGEATYRGPLTFSLPTGTWTATSITQVPRSDLDSLGYNIDNEPFRAHFKTGIVKFLQNPTYTKDLNDIFQFTVKPNFNSKPFLYLGAFQPIVKLDSKTIEAAVFKRSFALRDFRRVFGERQVYNGYTGERIIHDKILGTISVLFQQIDSSGWNTASFKTSEKAALQKITYCVNRADRNNPLFDASGSILMRHAASDISDKKNEFKFTDSSDSVQNFKNCLVTQFTSTTKSLFGKELLVDAQIYGL